VDIVDNLPLIDATGLTKAQRIGRSCVSCRKRFPRPTIAVGVTEAGEFLYRCPECIVILEPVDSASSKGLTVSPESGRLS
jgi:hypothetical protein